MAWTEITREQYRRDALRYASDMMDAEWVLVELLLPRANRRGRPQPHRSPSSPRRRRSGAPHRRGSRRRRR